MAVGSLIRSARYNNLQGRVSTILGVGSGSDGYGQSLESKQVIAGDDVTATDMANLYVDMVKSRIHQTGSTPTDISLITSGNLITEGDGRTGGTTTGIADFERIMTNIENDRFLLAPSEAVLENGISSVRSTAWNGKLTHEVTVTFDSEDDRRFFFNSGGEIRLRANISGGFGDKTNDWRVILTNLGVVKFNYTATSSTGTGTGSNIGNYELTGTYVPIFNKTGSGAYALYSANSYTISARAPDYVSLSDQGSRIQFKIEVADNSTDRNIDNNVTGTLTSTLQLYRADTDNVRVKKPNFSNTRNLS